MRAALDGVALAVLDDHVGRCADEPEDERAHQVMAAVALLMRRV